MSEKKYLILSGGTGGHVIPAVNFGNFIIDRGYECFLCVDERGIKYTNSFKGQIRVISSSHLSYNLLGNAKSIISLVTGFFQSWKYLINGRLDKMVMGRTGLGNVWSHWRYYGICSGFHVGKYTGIS